MTDFDKNLIEKANGIRRWDWRQINDLISIAESIEAKTRLLEIQEELRAFVQETL